MKKIVFLAEGYFSENDIEKFGINYFKEKGIKIEIFNISPITRNKYYNNYGEYRKIHKFENQTFFFKKEEIISAIKKLNIDDFVILIIGINKNTKFIMNLFHEKKIKTAYLSFAALPLPKKSVLEILKISIRHPLATVNQILKKIKNYKTNFKGNYSPHLDFIFCSGSKLYQNYKKTDKAINIIKIPTLDYDKFLLFRREESDIKKEKKDYVLYIDSPRDHPDQIFLENRYPPEKFPAYEEFYFPINNFFQNLKKKTKYEVKIAAHPKSYYKNKNPYNFGNLYYNQIANLTANAKIVFLLDSTAVNFPVLFNKPIFFLTHDKLTYRYKKNIFYLAKYFQKKPINISKSSYNDFNFLYKAEVNKNLYKKFEKEFIIDTNDPGNTSYKIVYESLKKYAKNG